MSFLISNLLSKGKVEIILRDKDGVSLGHKSLLEYDPDILVVIDD